MKILKKSELIAAGIDPEQVPSLIEHFRKERDHHREHMEKLEKEKRLKRGPKSAGERRQEYPAPVFHAILADVIDSDFEIVDDGGELKTAELSNKKMFLFQQIDVAEIAERSKVLPAGKIKLAALRYNDVLNADHERLVASEDPKHKFGEGRSEEDQKIVDEYESAQKIFDKITRWSAERAAEVEDLTLENIDRWQMKPFEG